MEWWKDKGQQVVGWSYDKYNRKLLPVWLNLGELLDVARMNIITTEKVIGVTIWNPDTEEYEVVYDNEPEEEE